MDFDPKAYLQDDSTGFNPKEYLGDTGPSELASLGRGAAQGLSFGLRDEAAGALKSPVGALKEIANKFGQHFSDEDIDNYRRERDASRQLDAVAKAANPKSYLGGQIAGALPTAAIPGMGLAEGAGLADVALQGAAQGATFGVGGSTSDNIGGLARDAAIGGATGAAGGALGYGLGQAVSKGLPMIGNAIGEAAEPLENTAENLAVKATGATGKQTEKFADDAGRQLLDRGLVKFGDSPSRVAERLGEASDNAGQDISQALSGTEAQGINANVSNVIQGLEDKVSMLRKDPSQAGVVRKLQGIIDDIKSTGQMEVPVSQAEQTKRGFNKIAGNWLDPESGQAGKEAYRGYRNEVERAVGADQQPYTQLGQKFKNAKDVYGLLAPIQEAAEKRAATLNQSPFGGLGDTAAAAVARNPIAAVPAAIGRRIFAPRLASSFAVTADNLSKLAASAPEALGKFAPVMQSAAQRGTQAVAATHFILEQTNPEYREIVNKLNGSDEK